MEINQFLLETERFYEVVSKLKLEIIIRNSRKFHKNEADVLSYFNELEHKTLFEQKVLSELYYSIPFMQTPRSLTIFIINNYMDFIQTKKLSEDYINFLSNHIIQKNKVLKNNMLSISSYEIPYLNTLIQDEEIDYFARVLKFRQKTGFELLTIDRDDFIYIDKLIKSEFKK